MDKLRPTVTQMSSRHCQADCAAVLHLVLLHSLGHEHLKPYVAWLRLAINNRL